ncbi:RNA-directed DNA polymerase from mobile element jockey isoform X3 [Bactrocera neohumeralis]|uniref:RNA-directed DNA polymerase from mobile element jockey isoform X3 n=1 Tax=Bactrocera neohumeralis TaxID=98809 RepID=UPI0021651151|nr:RNA-directed DNA polymerase from mobile element jockey isoform X3 [Bactrocera neohumeralis]
MSVLNICLWNANGVNQHKLELIRFLDEKSIDVMLLSETHLTNKNNFFIPGFRLYVTNHPDGKAHGGTAVLVRKRLNHHTSESYATAQLQATTITIKNRCGDLNLTAIYCPPRFKITDIQFKDFFGTLGHRFIAGGDYNAKHTYWGSRLINPKGRQLYHTIINRHNNLDIISPGKPTYWPSDRKKIPDLIDFAVIKNIDKSLITADTSTDLSSDHSPVLIKLCEQPIFVNPKVGLTSYKTNWLKYKKYVSSHINVEYKINTGRDIDESIEELNDIITKAAVLATPNKNYISRLVPEKLLTEK